ncbi:hypothetical protein HWV23_03860 [Natronomonas halophila]|uniref:hypothetical protein n=1 Tax=Natronomonas halophila TaxID=2747817 RepID=UPI0015B61DC7|nr:hypothetical protein [Natronomonas halophila]QLD84887.1 hypothetical protein HWV23_03860 [Natronomonas halophila]
MDTRLWRLRISGWGAVAVGIVGSAFAFTLLGTDGLFGLVCIALFAVCGVGGVFLLSGRERCFYYVLPVIGTLALVLAGLYYLWYGFATLTLALLLVTVATLAKSLQAYHIYDRNA